MKVEEKDSGSKHALSIQTLLLERHRALLTRQTVTHVTGRLLSFGLLVLVAFLFSPNAYSTTSAEAWSTRPSRLSLLLLSLSGVIIGFFWGYLVRTSEEQLGRLEEIIVQGNDIGRDLGTQKKEQQAAESDNDSREDSKEVDRWRQIYIEWKHEAWKHPNRQRLLRLEPFAWFVLVIAFLLIKLVFRSYSY
jgi:hypothetical protein